jgi:hypothetical protein
MNVSVEVTGKRSGWLGSNALNTCDAPPKTYMVPLVRPVAWPESVTVALIREAPLGSLVKTGKEQSMRRLAILLALFT